MIKWKDVIDETLRLHWKLFLDEFIIVNDDFQNTSSSRAISTSCVYDFLEDHQIDLTELVYVLSPAEESDKYEYYDEQNYNCCLLKIAVRELAPGYVIQVLLDADIHGITVCDKETMSKLLEQYVPCQQWIDSHMAKPLLYTILDTSTESKYQAEIPKTLSRASMVKERNRILESISENNEKRERNETDDGGGKRTNSNDSLSNWRDESIRIDTNGFAVEESFVTIGTSASQIKHSAMIQTRTSQYEKPINGLRIPKPIFYYIAISVSKNPQLRNIINRKTADRVVFVSLVADFYFNTALTIAYCVCVSSTMIETRKVQIGAKQETVTVQADVGYILFLSATLAYFVIREIIQIWSFGWSIYKLSSSANGGDSFVIFEWTKIVLVLVSLIWMSIGIEIKDIGVSMPDEDTEEITITSLGTIPFPYKTFLTVTSAFVFLGFILFLRNTYLPFTQFVNGALNIIKELIPFLIVTGIILCAFAFMYYIARFDDGVNNDGQCDDSDNGNFCTYSTAFYNVFGYLASGPDETSDWLDVLTGVVVVIVFLNVVIAIVTNVWDVTEQKVAVYFWQQRLYYLAGIRKLRRISPNIRRSFHIDTNNTSLSDQLKKYWNKFLYRLVDKIETVGKKRAFDRITWDVAPYSYVKDKETYDDPFENSEIKEKLNKACAEVEMKWKYELNDMKSYEADFFKFSNGYNEKIHILYDFFLQYLCWYLLFLFLGFITFGWAWPKHIRQFLLNIPNEEKINDHRYDDDDDRDVAEKKNGLEKTQHTNIQKENEALKEENEKLRREIHYLMLEHRLSQQSQPGDGTRTLRYGGDKSRKSLNGHTTRSCRGRFH